MNFINFQKNPELEVLTKSKNCQIVVYSLHVRGLLVGIQCNNMALNKMMMGFGGIFCLQGIAFLPSFGIGVAIFTPIITAIPFVTGPQWPNFAVQATILPGIASGVVWNIGTTPRPYSSKSIVKGPKIKYSPIL